MSSLTADASRPMSTRCGGSSGSLAGRPAARRPRRACHDRDANVALLPSSPVTPVLVIAAGLAAIAFGSLLLRSYGPRVRVGRLLTVTPVVTLATARELALAGTRHYVRVDGRLDADEELADEHDRPLVYRRRRVEARLRGGWRILDEQRDMVPFRLREGLDEAEVDAGALDVGLVTLVRESVGTAGEVDDTLTARLPSADPDPVAYRAALVGRTRHGPRRPGHGRHRHRPHDTRDRAPAGRLHARTRGGDARPCRRSAGAPDRSRDRAGCWPCPADRRRRLDRSLPVRARDAGTTWTASPPCGRRVAAGVAAARGRACAGRGPDLESRRWRRAEQLHRSRACRGPDLRPGRCRCHRAGRAWSHAPLRPPDHAPLTTRGERPPLVEAPECRGSDAPTRRGTSRSSDPPGVRPPPAGPAVCPIGKICQVGETRANVSNPLPEQPAQP